VPWVGQLVPIEVALWRPQAAGPLEPFSLDDVVAPGMIAKWSEQSAPPDERREGDAEYLVQHRTLLLFPQAEGELVLPPLVARWHDGAAHADAFVASKELAFRAAIPEGAGEPLPLIAGSVRLEQAFDRELSQLRVGDGFTRSVTLHATDTDLIVFPEIVLGDASGLRAYPAAASAGTSTERGQIEAQLVLRSTYVVERVGRHTLPGVSLRWLEPRSGRYQEATVPALTLWTGPNAALGFQCLGTAPGAAVVTELGSLGLLLLFGVAFARRRRRGPGRRESALRARSRERRAFHRLLRSLRTSGPWRMLGELYAWLPLCAAASDRTLAPLARATREADQACSELERSLFRASTAREVQVPQHLPERLRQNFARSLRRARRVLRRPRRSGGLASLN
jgi:hypothetical protein